MWLLINNVIICLSLFRILIHECMMYVFGYSDVKTSICSAIKRCSVHNIITIKVAQSLMGFHEFSPEAVKALTHNSYDVNIEDDEIDIILLNQILKDYDITLTDNKPFHSGMIAIVYLGIMQEKPVVIKLKRLDITKRLIAGCSNVNFIYDFLNFIAKINTNLKKIMLSFKSISQTTEYLISQSNFENEINVLSTTKRELGECQSGYDIAIPAVYNKPSDIHNTEFIIMEYFDGKFATDITDTNELDEYLKILVKFVILQTWICSYMHTDMHCGNAIYFKEDGILKMGVIDFGMNLRMTDRTRTLVCFVIDQMESEHMDAQILLDFLTTDPPIILSKLPLITQDNINTIVNNLHILIKKSNITERDLATAMDSISNELNANIVIDLTMLVVLISISMGRASLSVLSGYDDTKCTKIIKEVYQDLIE